MRHNDSSLILLAVFGFAVFYSYLHGFVVYYKLHCPLSWVVLTTARIINGFLVSNETVVLRPWETWKQKFGFIKRVAKGWITTVKDLEGLGLGLGVRKV